VKIPKTLCQSVVLGLLFFVLSPKIAIAETLFTCNDSHGQVFYAEGGMVNKEDSGWDSDKITNFKVSVTVNDEGEMDLLFYDSSETLKSAKDSGASVLPLGYSDQTNTMAILVNWPDQTVETYAFNAVSNQLYWTQIRYGWVMTKVMAMVSLDCQ
jgi:hypothetical protein